MGGSGRKHRDFALNETITEAACPSAANGDGVVTRDEAPDPIKTRFDRIEANADGMLEADELSDVGRGRQGGAAAVSPTTRILQFDANGDGLIGADEMPERMAQMFARFDTSGDGVIDEKELAAMVDRMPGRER